MIKETTLTNTINSDTTTNNNAAPVAPESNDNSNPQQGTGGRLASSTASSPLAKNSKEASSQQPARVNLKIPPSKKDDRKLFVGGLPSDGTYLNMQTMRHVILGECSV
jgi:hypothetical protein